jgi:hypothetical protein
LLARSRYFTQEDIRLRHAFFNGVLHQYLQVRIGNDWIIQMLRLHICTSL